MITTIGPVVSRKSTVGRRAAVTYLVGGILGGSFIGFLVSILALLAMPLWVGLEMPPGIWLGVAALACLGAIFDAMGGSVMGARRQTPKAWRHLLSPPWFSFLYGFDLGLGVTTRIYFASFLGTLAAIVLVQEPTVGTLIGAIFGGSRAATTLVLSGFSFLEPSRPELLVARSRRLVSLVSSGALALAGMTIVAWRIL